MQRSIARDLWLVAFAGTGYTFEPAWHSAPQLRPDRGPESRFEKGLRARRGAERFLQQAPLQVRQRIGRDVIAQRLIVPHLLQLALDAEQCKELKRFLHILEDVWIVFRSIRQCR